LRKALQKARFILFDGYFWTRNNFLHASEFLYCYRDVIESCVILPGYTGELLIKPRRATDRPSNVVSSSELRSTYTASYYLQDCGEFDAYKLDKGFSLSDPRLRAVADVADLSPVGRAIDLGCAAEN
jgi:hypothetical protein